MSPDSRKIRLILDLRRGGVTEPGVLSAIERVPREQFVPPAFRDQAYENLALPIGHQQTISQTVVVGKMTQALEVGARHKVLEVGTGSGYQAAVLAQLCRRLYTVERHRDLLKSAEDRLNALKLFNISTRCGDGTEGWPGQAPFDRIMVTAAADDVPGELVDQLAESGILVAPVREGADRQTLIRLRRTADGERVETLDTVHFVPLVSDAETSEANGR